ncbi:MAG: GNAT family N-acetyltransferase [Acetobacteraceae bacterium]
MQVRSASETDLAAIQAIYAHHVLNGTGSFEEIPPSVEEMTERFRNVAARGCAWLVAEDESGVLGYGYYAQFRPRSAYRYTCENSVYVREDVRRQGVGKALLAKLLQAAEGQGFRQMIAVIGDAENTASVGVHASLGFSRVAHLKSCGLKFGRWLDCIYMQTALGRGAADVPAAAGLRAEA